MRILVRYVGQDISHPVLTRLFEAHGQVESVKALRGGAGGGGQRAGAVTMPNEDEARAAIEALDGRALKGQRLSVKEAKRL